MEIINLDMTPSTVTPNAHAGQYDSARTVRFMLKNGGVPFTLAGTETITAEITRSDNTEVTVNVANTSSNYVDVVFDDTVCTVKGLYACELRLKDSDGFDIGSKNFALLVQRDPYDNKNVRIVTVGPTDICTFETTLAEPLQSVTVNVLATGGNGTPDNPNPINGYTEANITRCGVNLWDFTEIIASSSVSNYYFNFPSKTYTLSFELENATYQNGGAALFDFYDKDGTNFAYPTPTLLKRSSDDASMSSLTQPLNDRFYFTFTNSLSRIRLNFVTSGYGQWTGKIKNVTLTEGTAKTYHHYNGQTFTAAFGQTVYGGVLDVTRGKLRVTHEIMTPTILNMQTNYSNIDYAKILKTPANKGYNKYEYNGELSNMCQCLKNTNNYDTADNIGKLYTAATSDVYWIGVTKGTTVDEARALYSGIEILYELATPFDIDLTPEVISAVVGTNNVYGDCGQTTVKYLKVEA